MKVVLLIINVKDLESIFTLVETFIVDNGKKMIDMEKQFIFIVMVANLKEDFPQTKEMEKELIIGQMETVLKEFGKMAQGQKKPIISSFNK